jgi:ankyrin repeat protein
MMLDAALPKVLEWLKVKEPKTAGNMQEEGQAGNRRLETRTSGAVNAAADLLIKKLTSQRDNKNGSTPLHLAASLWGFPSTQWNPVWSWRTVSSSAITKLLDANPSVAYQADNEGLYPIHVSAAVGGNMDIKIRLLGRCPDCASLRDGKGRTFLHVAVEKEMLSVVKYVCETPSLSWMLNAQDSNGDTALHRAVHAGDVFVFWLLFRNPQVRLDVPNNEGMRPIDVSWSMMPLEAYYAWVSSDPDLDRIP